MLRGAQSVGWVGVKGREEVWGERCVAMDEDPDGAVGCSVCPLEGTDGMKDRIHVC